MSNAARLKLTGIIALLAVLCILPSIVRPYQLDVLIFLFINIILVLSDLISAITGELSLAHAVIMGVGAYTSALLPISPWISLPLGGLPSAVIAYILSRNKAPNGQMAPTKSAPPPTFAVGKVPGSMMVGSSAA